MKKNKGNTNVNLELDRSASYNQFSAKQITDVSRLLESPDSKVKVQLMRDLKWDQTLTRTEALIGNEKERSDLMKAFDHGSVSKIDEIKEIAVTYGLKFLPATVFKCPERHELELATMIANFLLNKKIDHTGFSKNSFYILADEKYFVKRQGEINDEVGAFIFYKPPKDKENFLRVDYIGDGELTFRRYLKGWSTRNAKNAISHAAILAFLVALPIFSAIGFFQAVILALVFALLSAALVHWDSEKKGGFNETMWDKISMGR